MGVEITGQYDVACACVMLMLMGHDLHASPIVKRDSLGFGISTVHNLRSIADVT